MFTGIVEETGSIRSLRLSGSSGKIAIRAKKVLGGTRIGDSIAVNGVCLTVVSLEKDGFTADVMAETVRRTNLGDTKIGEKVNLERAMLAIVTVTFPGSPSASAFSTRTMRVRRLIPSASSTTRTISPGRNFENLSPVSRWRSIAPIS